MIDFSSGDTHKLNISRKIQQFTPWLDVHFSPTYRGNVVQFTNEIKLKVSENNRISKYLSSDCMLIFYSQKENLFNFFFVLKYYEPFKTNYPIFHQQTEKKLFVRSFENSSVRTTRMLYLNYRILFECFNCIHEIQKV